MYVCVKAAVVSHSEWYTNFSSGSVGIVIQQLLLANTTADRFDVLPQDEQFKFDFNHPSLTGKGGKRGDVIAANRKTFPALVGTGSGMAVGFLKGCGFNTPHIHPRATELETSSLSDSE